MSKYINAIINEARESTENEDFGEETGISEEEIVKFINQAQNRLHSRIVAQHPQVFIEDYTTSIVANQEAYSLPSHKAFLKNKISSVEYSNTGDVKDYVVLDPEVLKNRYSGNGGEPCRYIRRSGSILLVPIPDVSKGSLRLAYVRKVKKLDKRRGSVQAVTTANSQITNLEINYPNSTTIDPNQLRKDTRFTVVDKYGNIKMENVLLSSLTTSASYDATVVVDSSFTFGSDESISVGDFIVPGAYTTTHLELGPEIERYIQVFTEYKILKRDSSADSQEAFQELSEIEVEIIESYAEISDDILGIPEINEDDWGF